MDDNPFPLSGARRPLGEDDAETGEYGPDKDAIRRYQKSGGEYRQKSKFNISSAEQARKIVDALSGWLADA